MTPPSASSFSSMGDLLMIPTSLSGSVAVDDASSHAATAFATSPRASLQHLPLLATLGLSSISLSASLRLFPDDEARNGATRAGTLTHDIPAKSVRDFLQPVGALTRGEL